MPQKDSYQDSQLQKSNDDQKDKGHRDDARRVLGGVLENVVDLGLLAVSRGRGGRHSLVSITCDGQREDGAVICLGAAERSDNNTGVDGLGKGQKLDREVFLGLTEELRLAVSPQQGRA